MLEYLTFLCLCIREAAVEEERVIEGIDGILNRLEKERISSLRINTSKYGYGANRSSRDNIDNRSSGTTTTGKVNPFPSLLV